MRIRCDKVLGVASLLFGLWTNTADAARTGGLLEAARALRMAEDGKQLWLAPDAEGELKGDFIARLEKEAAAGNVKAEATLALCHHLGVGVPPDLTKAASRYQKAAKAGHAGAQNNLGLLYDAGTGVPADPAKAHELYVASAAQGFADAQFNIGLNYATGVAVPQDWRQAKTWYTKAVAQGHLPAMNNLGNIFLLGRGVPVDLEAARKHLQKPAEAGIAVSQYSFAATYLTQRRFAEAAPWLQRSAEGGYMGGQFHWAVSLWEGLGVAKDFPEALKWARKAVAGATGVFAHKAGEANGLIAQILLTIDDPKDSAEAFHAAKVAAEAGIARGQHLLGVCYHRGAGVARDLPTAIQWYRLSAAQKYSESASTLGVLSESGVGMPRDYAEAAKWYRLAADGGNVVAMYRLGLFYRDGTGVPADLSQAAQWLREGLRRMPNEPDLKSALADVERQLTK